MNEHFTAKLSREAEKIMTALFISLHMHAPIK